MGTNTDDLRAVAEERRPLPEGFEISAAVRAAAMVWPTRRIQRVDQVCAYQVSRGGKAGVCGQVIVPVSVNEESYEYTDEEYEGLVLAHLMQRHGWSRENVGEC